MNDLVREAVRALNKEAEIYAAAVVSAWENGEPDGLLLVALYMACGMSKEDARATVLAMRVPERV